VGNNVYILDLADVYSIVVVVVVVVVYGF